ncbi:MAG: YihY/virulence factor BrkB family protein [bacterium]
MAKQVKNETPVPEEPMPPVEGSEEPTNGNGVNEPKDEIPTQPVRRALYHAWRFTQITFREILSDRIPLKSMALTFATLLSIIPLLAFSFSLFRLFGGGEWFADTLRPFILENLAPGTGPRVAERIQELIDSAGSATLGGLGVLLLVMAVYSIFTGIESTVNAIWDARSRAGSLQRLPLYWGMVTIVPILVVGSLAISTYLQAVPLISEAVRKVDVGAALFNRILSIVMVVGSFFLLYRFVPATKVRTRYAAIGALTSGLLFEGFKATFIVYTADLVQYDVIYGSLAIFPLLLIWVNLSWILVLGGVEISFVAQNYRSLLHKPKHVKLSRNQKNAVAYLLLKEVTAAFRAEREPVVLEEWARQWQIPLGLANETTERLRNGGVIELAEKGYTTVLLTRVPEKVTIADIEALLALETANEWEWPGESSWQWLQNWMKTREKISVDSSEVKNLSELVHRLNNSSSKRNRKRD